MLTCCSAPDIALECSGFLSELGFDTTVMVRSQLLRGFDRQCVDKIEQSLVHAGVKFMRNAVPVRLERAASGAVLCTYECVDGGQKVRRSGLSVNRQ